MGRLVGNSKIDVICSYPILGFFDSSASYYLISDSSSASHSIIYLCVY